MRNVRCWTETPDGRGSIWSGIRFLRQFSLVDLERVAQQPYDHCKKYVRLLVKGGYLRLEYRANTRLPGDLNRYRLIRDSGPLPPIPRDKLVVWDPNIGQEFEFGSVLTGQERIWNCIAEIPDGETFDAVGIQGLTGANLRSIRKYLKAFKDQGLIAGALESYRERGVYVRVYKEGSKSEK